MTPGPVDFDAVRKNAAEQGVSLDQISILYDGLTEEEIASMEIMGLLVLKTSAVTMCRFAPDGTALFPEKSIAVISL